MNRFIPKLLPSYPIDITPVNVPPDITLKFIEASSEPALTSSEETYNQREGIYIYGVQESFLSDNFLINKYFENEDFIFSDNSIIIGNYLSKKINKKINDEVDLLFIDDVSGNFIAKRFIIQNIFYQPTHIISNTIKLFH